jgi:formylmethanofuran dehydrogenase subunit E
VQSVKEAQVKCEEWLECDECGNVIAGKPRRSAGRILCEDCREDEKENERLARKDARRGMRHG